MNFKREDWSLVGDPGPGDLVVVNIVGGARVKAETITYTVYRTKGQIYLHVQEKEDGRTTDKWFLYRR